MFCKCKIKGVVSKDNSCLVAEAGLEPRDLRVMSPTSYQLLYSAVFRTANVRIFRVFTKKIKVACAFLILRQ